MEPRLTRALTVLVIWALGPACTAPAPDTVPDRIRELAIAIQRHDSATMDRLLASDFPAGMAAVERGAMTRDSWLVIMLRRFDLDTVSIGEVALTRAGDTAKARYWMYWRGRVNRRFALDESLYVADVWVLHRGGWRLAGREVLDCRPPREEC